MKKNKPYWKESLECYLFVTITMILFVAGIVVSGQLTGTDWIGLLK
ncbi:hypothetical protein ABRT01_08205 [Lentibacillus sp. L22]|nr:hypothetical protein [Lentibacillus daqui]